jgi:sugar diacid utilization regulator
MSKFTDTEKKIILEMCENNLHVHSVARACHLTPNTIYANLEKIKEKTGLNPRVFYDLVELMDMVREDQEE